MPIARKIAATLLAVSVSPAMADPQSEFRQLPEEVRIHVSQIRAICREMLPDAEEIIAPMRGIQALSLTADGSNDIIVDNEQVCNKRTPAANCSNRGCDVLIFKKMPWGEYSKIFQEHLYEKYFVIDYEHSRLQLIVASIYAGDKRCNSGHSKDYNSGQSCNVFVRYKDGHWNWERIK